MFNGFNIVEPLNKSYAVLHVVQELRLVDVTSHGAQGVGTVAAIGSIVDVSITQEWSRFLYTEFPMADGVLYASANNAEDALALYERAAGKLSLRRQFDLQDAGMEAALHDASDANRLELWW